VSEGGSLQSPLWQPKHPSNSHSPSTSRRRGGAWVLVGVLSLFALSCVMLVTGEAWLTASRQALLVTVLRNSRQNQLKGTLR
jgi:hypothetical protein